MTSRGKQKYLFHPFEIGFCGFSGSGKTTLIEKILNELHGEYRIGYAKHDAHKFSMDRPGKDTFRARAAGADSIMINDPSQTAWLGSGEDVFFQQRQVFFDCDFVIVEGYKTGPCPKLVFLDSELQILEEIDKSNIDKIIAFVGEGPKPGKLAGDCVYFERNDVQGVVVYLTEWLCRNLNQSPLNGLVLAGGHSRRMGQDKALLSYHGKNQARFGCDLLAPFVDQVFLSLRKDQWGGRNPAPGVETIEDQMLGFGPVGGILSAMRLHPKAAWLVVACDLPFLEVETIKALIRERKPLKPFTFFESASDSLPEPLCAIYEPRSYVRLFAAIGLGYECPRKVLINSEGLRLKLPNPKALDNINTPDEFSSAQSVFRQGGDYVRNQTI